MTNDLDERWAERDHRREAYEAEMERQRQEHKARPLVERLRDCGTFTAADGFLSYAPPRADDAKEAADEIERLQALPQEQYEDLLNIAANKIEHLQGLLKELEWSGNLRVFGNFPACPWCGEYQQHGHSNCELAKALGR